ncbi:helix-turn-helix transcriptional regulator [Metasolibacillus meyeri]|uniref:helix-turn-helix transcriptional regulator n=1 Tax=Metasolibacillus meyeri TaxID=1071052 RepID=UPI000D308338|nr:helix-turn-helix transcriptional regulator [Metasolibacillus meyeri]
MRTWLKEIRMQKGYTQEFIADNAEIERAYYTMIEQGNRNPSVAVAKSIAACLGFDWTLFFEDKCNEMTHLSLS